MNTQNPNSSSSSEHFTHDSFPGVIAWSHDQSRFVWLDFNDPSLHALADWPSPRRPVKQSPVPDKTVLDQPTPITVLNPQEQPCRSGEARLG